MEKGFKDYKKVNCLILKPEDNVGILINSSGKKGQGINLINNLDNTIRLKNNVPLGHKVAIKEIKMGRMIIKNGNPIGLSSKLILPGEYVHIHNIRFDKKLHFSSIALNNHFNGSKDLEELPLGFNGFLRKDGRAGIRNYIVVVSTVNCSATVVKEIGNYFKNKQLYKEYGIDGVIPITHPYGCPQESYDHAQIILKRTIAGWIDHPNVVGCVLVGLGCEVLNVSSLEKSLGVFRNRNKVLLSAFNIQENGGTKQSIDLGVKKVKEILTRLPVFKRKNLPVSLLTVGLNCGGSDSFSFLTANPCLGIVSDILISRGATAVLAEIPECFGADKLLISRCKYIKDRIKLKKIFSWWNTYGSKYAIDMNKNLSLGNISSGISTILEKSLGSVSKIGVSSIKQVLDYGERIIKTGATVMNTPGYDPVSVTGLAAGGCNMIAFTTGLGSTYGCSIAPTIKISTNADLYKRLADDIDIDASGVLCGKSYYVMTKEIYKYFIKVANGYKTASERLGIGREEFLPWYLGQTL